MPLSLNVGLSKKVGLPDFGSLGAQCHVQLELESSLLETDLERFHQHVRRAYLACAQAVHEELARQLPTSQLVNGSAAAHAPSGTKPAANGQPARRTSAARKATQSQVRAIQAIASRQEVDLERLLSRRFRATSAAELSITQASQLIDELKGLAHGSEA
jgi:hypothetical protein